MPEEEEAEGGKKKDCGRVIMRSGLSMMRYLGAIVRNQDEKWFKELQEKPLEFEPPIKIYTDEPPNNIAVSVTYDGHSYYVSDDDNSMRSLGLVSLLLALNQSSEDLPSTPTVISIGQ